MDDTENFLRLYARIGNHRRLFIELLDSFNRDSAAVLSASRDELRSLGLTVAQVNKIGSSDDSITESCLQWLQDPEHQLIRFDSTDYPALLAEIADFPPLLFAKGQTNLIHRPQVAIVGSRLCSSGGRKHAEQFAESLAACGFVITSGLAQGIDAAAHRGALKQKASTIAVLGTGPDRIYPARHQALAQEIAESGLILSEFMPGTGPAKHHFPRRNRVISGLSLATLVVEASMRSGSLITARLASEQGRDVFAIPGSIHNPQARGCHQLIRDGAVLTENVEQITNELGPLLGYLNHKNSAACEEAVSLAAEEQSLLQHIAFDPVTIDQLCESSGLTIDKLSSILLALELKQVIESAPGGRIVRI